MTSRWTCFWLGWMWCFCTGCYRPAAMHMEPLFRPWLSRTKSSPAPSSHKFRPIVKELGLSEVVFHLLHSNPRLQHLRQRFRVVQAGVGAVSPVMNPELRIMGISGGVLTNQELNPFGIRLRWEPPVPTVYGAKKDLTVAMVQVEQQSLRAETYQLLYQARNLYVQVLATELLLQNQAQQVERSKRIWLWEQARQRSNRSSALQVASRHLVYLQQLSSLQQWHVTRNIQKMQLQELLGIQGPCDLKPSALFSLSSSVRPESFALLKQALQRSPQLATIQSLYRAAHAELWLEKTKRIPWFSYVQLSYEFGQSFWPHGFTLGMGLNLPVFDWNTGKIYQQEVKIHSLKMQAEIEIKTMVHRVKAAHQQWQLAQRILAEHRKQMQQSVQQSQQLASRSLAQPGVDPLQIWRMQEQISKLQQQSIVRMLQWHEAKHHLDLVTFVPVWTRLGIVLPKESSF